MNKCCNITGKIDSKQTVTGMLNGKQAISGGLNLGILGVKSIYQFGTKFEFPTIGDSYSLYIATSENAAYRWKNAAYRWNEADLHYYCVGRDYLELEVINGGNADE